ncbi:hypothetical protein GCM10011316_06520 [Roseibium aquae]|uniref:Mce/MlaD domain-containing protein n=1 Tax=Roseibium aquae TaxID=1323746 RepID=A0A916T9N7_9HYPH|nr:MlaD family protein [Roseibium aquae]GGB37110.1 hypothetical protein GCM10011316_06520 [Roseibium aquae]
METRANYIVIGAFVMATLLAAFGFVYWLAVTAESRENVFMKIVFPAPVTGLPVGGQVLFNGIRIGDVSSLDFDPSDPTKVIATVRVRPSAPLRSDTKATLNFTGLTGVAYVDLNGGSLDAPLLLANANGETPVIYAERSLFDDLTDGTRDVLQKADGTLTQLEALLQENRPVVARTLGNVETFSEALAANTDGVSQFMDSIASASDAFTSLSGRMETLVEQGERLLASVPADEVTSIVNDFARFSETLGDASGDIELLLTDARQAAQNLEGFTQNLNAGVEDARRIINAVNPDDVRRVAEGAGALGDVLKARSGELDRLVSSSAQTMENVAEISDSLAGQRETLAQVIERGRDVMVKADQAMDRGLEIVASVQPDLVSRIIASTNTFAENLNTSLGQVDAIIAGVDPERVRQAVTDASAVLDNIRNREGEINEIIASTTASMQNIEVITATVRDKEDEAIELVADLRRAATQFTETLASANSVISAIDPTQVASIVGSVESVTGGLAGQRQSIDEIILSARSAAQNVERMTADISKRTPDVDQIITDAQQLTANLNATSVRIQGIVDNVGTMVDADGEGFIMEATAAAAAIRKVAEAFESRAGTIADGLAKFSNQGASDFSAAMAQVNRTLVAIQRAVESFDRNPQRVIFGGEEVPTYTGGRRR